jgi:hypothetical protein
MSMDPVTFQGRVSSVLAHYPFYANKVAEAQAIVTALQADTTTKDTTLKTAPSGLRPGHRLNTPFTNDLLLVVNRGKGGNLSNQDMADEIGGELGTHAPPVNVDVPHATGTGALGGVVTVTNGNWLYSPTGYTYQWRRGTTTAIAGATAANYTIVAADVTAGAVNCLVTATNAAGSTPIASNSIAVTALGG